jgi:N-acetylglucosamine-6-phosphate deacetylase
MEASGENILQITLAPELKDALTFIRQVTKKNIIVALGHHNGSAEIIHKAADIGASMVTHLGNGCANQINRHHNPLWPQLAEDRLSISIIADGRHLTQDEVRTFYKAKGADKVILTSDITKFTGMTPGEYDWGDRKIRLTKDGYIKNIKEDVLAGSALTLDKGVENMIQFTGCSLGKAHRMATLNPADLYGLVGCGKIEAGKRADLILFVFRNRKILIHQTIVGGKVVFDANKKK